MHTRVTTWHLEMTSLRELAPARVNPPLDIRRAEIASPELSRYLYTAVGGDWYWIDRLDWTFEQWMSYLERPELETWVAYVRGTPAGYFELERQAGDDVEIAYFGLVPQFIGQKIGGALLTAAVERGWQMGPKRVWVHTCTLDGPAALQNYKARGFRVFKTEEHDQELPTEPPGPWPGAHQPIPCD